MDNPSHQYQPRQPQQFVGHGNRAMMDQLEKKVQPQQNEQPCSICNLKYGSSARNNIPGVT